jgi:basic membrane protein A
MFRKLMTSAAAALVLALSAGSALALDPAVIYDLGGKFDKSFNQAAHEGAERFFRETGIRYRDFEPTSEAQYEQALRRFAAKGSDLIVVVGFSFAPALEKVAPEFPDTRFVIIDTVVTRPNVRSVLFKEHEGAFLVGMIAAMTSRTGKIGFVGGMDSPLIRRFALGYREGARYADKDVALFEDMTGTTPAAWVDPLRAGRLARSQFERGADVVFTAAGGSGMGVLQAAADAKKFAIGVDSNQNYIHPGSVLTSMVKRVDRAVYEAMRDARDGDWEPGLKVLGLAEGGVDYALDKYNESLIPESVRTRVDKAKADIIAGGIVVTDYYDIMDR